MVLDYESFEPLYHQLKVKIRNKIKSKIWKEGTLIPSESELCKTYKISRATVRQALQDLTNEGFLYRSRGKGTFVAQPKLESLLNDIYSFTKNMQRQGLNPSSVVMKQKVISPPLGIIEELKLSATDKVVFLERIRKVDSLTVMLDRAYIPSKLCPGLESMDLTKSLYQIIKDEYKYNFAKARESIEIDKADKRVAKCLEINEGTIVMFKKRLTYLDEGTPIEYSYQYVRGDRCRFVIELTHMPMNIQFKK